MRDDKSFTFRIPTPLLDEIHIMAAEQDLSVAQIVRKVLREFVDNQKKGTL